jgi:hypothetical protein
MMLESILGIAYAVPVMPIEPEPAREQPIRPLQDVWLRPRRVFRELASQPIGRVDLLLGAAQGMVSWLALSRTQNAGATAGVAEILGKALFIGSLFGIVSLYMMAEVYTRLGKRIGGAATRSQVIHVLAYGGLPMAVSLGIWILAALLAGEATFTQEQRPDVESFVALLLRAQFIAYVLLLIWSVVLQVMGFSEMQGLATRKAFGVWVLGQLIVLLAALFLAVLVATLLPGP